MGAIELVDEEGQMVERAPGALVAKLIKCPWTLYDLWKEYIFGFAGQVDGLVTRISDELDALYPDNDKISVIATGGLAPLVLGISETIDYHEPDLTLIGLRLVHERNG